MLTRRGGRSGIFQKAMRRCSTDRGFESLELRCLLDSTTVFNELMYAPTDGAPEWIELHNQMAVDMDLSGWSLASGIEYPFPEGTIIEGGGYLVVSSLPNALPQIRTLGPFRGRLANGGERIELRDNNWRLMSVIDYRDDGEWPVGADGSGASLSKMKRVLRPRRRTTGRRALKSAERPGLKIFLQRLTFKPESSISIRIGDSMIQESI